MRQGGSGQESSLCRRRRLYGRRSSQGHTQCSLRKRLLAVVQCQPGTRRTQMLLVQRQTGPQHTAYRWKQLRRQPRGLPGNLGRENHPQRQIYPCRKPHTGQPVLPRWRQCQAGKDHSWAALGTTGRCQLHKARKQWHCSGPGRSQRGTVCRGGRRQLRRTCPAGTAGSWGSLGQKRRCLARTRHTQSFQKKIPFDHVGKESKRCFPQRRKTSQPRRVHTVARCSHCSALQGMLHNLPRRPQLVPPVACRMNRGRTQEGS